MILHQRSLGKNGPLVSAMGLGCMGMLAQLVLAWILAKNENIIPIPGAKRVNHVEENFATLQVILSPEDLHGLEDIFTIGIAHGKKYPKEFECEA